MLFDSITARIAGIKSGESRRATPVQFLSPAESVQTIAEPHIARTVSERLKLLNEQIANTREILNAPPTTFCTECGQGGEMPAQHRAALLRALDSLLEREQDYLQLPGRGQRRPGSFGPKQSRARIEPVEPDSASNTPTGCSPERQPTPDAPQVAQEPKP